MIKDLFKKRKNKPFKPENFSRKGSDRIEDRLIFDPFVIQEEPITLEEAEKLRKLIKEEFRNKD